MKQPRPDHIAPPPGVLRRVLIMCVIVLSIGPIVWGLWALEAERRIAALRAQIEAETPPPPPCCKVGPEVPYDETSAYWANQARRRLPSKNPTYGISYELPAWERPTQLECHTVVFAGPPRAGIHASRGGGRVLRFSGCAPTPRHLGRNGR